MPPIMPRIKPINQPLPTRMLSNEKIMTTVPPTASIWLKIRMAPMIIMMANIIAIPPRTLNAIPAKNRLLNSSEPIKVITSPLIIRTKPRRKMSKAPTNENAKPKFALPELETGCTKNTGLLKTSQTSIDLRLPKCIWN